MEDNAIDGGIMRTVGLLIILAGLSFIFGKSAFIVIKYGFQMFGDIGGALGVILVGLAIVAIGSYSDK